MTGPARHVESFPIRAFECDLHGRQLRVAHGAEAARSRTVWRRSAAGIR
jgi:hypothetical protein